VVLVVVCIQILHYHRLQHYLYLTAQKKNKSKKRKAKTSNNVRAAKSKKVPGNRVSNRSFEAKRRNRVNKAMEHLKGICLRKTKEKTATKIEVLEMAIGLLAKVHNVKCMNFKKEYDRADATVGKELSAKAAQSGAADINRSIRERKRRMRVNILEAELSRLALSTSDTDAKKGASKCQILERTCAALGDPVEPLSGEDKDEEEQ